jgi:hypothetical protein
MERRNYVDKQTTRVQWRMVIGTDQDQVQRELDRPAVGEVGTGAPGLLAAVMYMLYGAFLLAALVCLTRC